MSPDIALTCPLCHAFTHQLMIYQFRRHYYHCMNCHLIFVAPHEHLDKDAEKAQYDLHQNYPHDQHYRQFLSRLYDKLVCHIPNGACGLDFGSGPIPVLSLMLQEAGYSMQHYDKFYAPNPSVLEQQYDFICLSEVAEHLHTPHETFNHLFSRIKPGGYAGIMTTMWQQKTPLSNWHYMRDPTHICFYHAMTMQWISRQWSLTCVEITPSVVIFQIDSD